MFKKKKNYIKGESPFRMAVRFSNVVSTCLYIQFCFILICSIQCVEAPGRSVCYRAKTSSVEFVLSVLKVDLSH